MKRFDLVTVKDIGNGLFLTGLFTAAWQYVTTQEVLWQITESVLTGFRGGPESFARIAKPEIIDQIAEGSVAERLQNPALARGIYDSVRFYVAHPSAPRRDVRVSIVLTPDTDSAATSEPMFLASVTCDYHTDVVPVKELFWYAPDREQYDTALADLATAGVWLTGEFRLTRYTINGTPQVIAEEHDTATGVKKFTVTPSKTDTPQGGAHMSYMYQVLTPQHGHLFGLDITKPSHGLHVTLTHHDCAIDRVQALDFLSTTHTARRYVSPEYSPTPTVSIGYDGWVLPRAGVAFIWTLEREL